MKMIRWAIAIAVTLAATTALAEERRRAAGAGEPRVGEVVDQALRYFLVNPDAIDSIRTSARTRALLPLVSGGYRFDDEKFSRNENIAVTAPQDINENTNRKSNGASVGAVWDLRELVFNPSEVQVYGLVAVQREIMLEVTRTYYLRRQLMLLRDQKPPEDPVTLATLELRIDEFTALLDVLTGGWFSKAASGQAADK